MAVRLVRASECSPEAGGGGVASFKLFCCENCANSSMQQTVKWGVDNTFVDANKSKEFEQTNMSRNCHSTQDMRFLCRN